MASVLIAYASTNGMTRECAERLAREMGGIRAVLCDLKKETPDCADYDVIVVGSPVRRGKLLAPVKAFLNAIAPGGEQPIGVFLCCGFADRFGEYRDRLIPKEILDRAFLVADFGGSLNPAGKPFWDKLWLFFARSSVVESEIDDGEYTPVLPGMIPESIGQMASFAKAELIRVAEKNSKNAQ